TKAAEGRGRPGNAQDVADRRDHRDHQPAGDHASAHEQNPCGPAAVVPVTTLACLSRHLRNFEITVRDCDFLPYPSWRPLRSVSEPMNPDTAELAIVESASEPAVPSEPRVPAWPAAGVASRPWMRLRAGLRSVELPQLDAERATAVRESWRALWSSRLLVWAAAVGTLVTFGFGPVRHAFNPPGLMRGFGWLGDLLAAPAARWDSAWYLVIAHYGYRPDLG